MIPVTQLTLPVFTGEFGSITIQQFHPEYPSNVRILAREPIENTDQDRLVVQVESQSKDIGIFTLTFIVGRTEKDFVYAWYFWVGSYLVAKDSNKKHYQVK